MATNEIIMAADGKLAHINLYGDIGGHWLLGGNTAESFGAALAEIPTSADVQVNVNSKGGDVREAVSMVAQLRRHRERYGVRVVAEVEGLAASAASLLVMAADEIRVMRGGQMMIHEARGTTAGGDADTHERNARLLRSVNEDAAKIYAGRTGQTIEAIREAMAAESWYNADAAVEFGLADKVVEGFAAVAQWSGELDMHFCNVPSALRARGKQPAPSARSDNMEPTQIAAVLGCNVGQVPAVLQEAATARAVVVDMRAENAQLAGDLEAARARILELEVAGRKTQCEAIMSSLKSEGRLVDGTSTATRAAKLVADGDLDGLNMLADMAREMGPAVPVGGRQSADDNKPSNGSLALAPRTDDGAIDFAAVAKALPPEARERHARSAQATSWAMVLSQPGAGYLWELAGFERGK
jgi:ATP-dependent Clp protease protease subunit